MIPLDWLVFLGFFFLGYGVYRVELVCRSQLKMLEQIKRALELAE